jgi:predicted amidohydrolase
VSGKRSTEVGIQVPDVKRDLLVGVAQWLAAPGEPRQNMNVALSMMDDAASRGVELLLLPELWSCGYDPETLAQDARADAEPLDGPRSARLGHRRTSPPCSHPATG